MPTVNENVYGSSNEWYDLISASDYDSLPKTANFGASEAETEPFNTILAAISNGKMKLNEEIDKSISYVGVDGGSFLTQLQWVENNPLQEDETENNPHVVTDIEVTSNNPLAFFSQKYSKPEQFELTAANKKSIADRKVFLGYNQIYNKNSNIDLESIPITMLPGNKMVFVIVVRCCIENPEEHEGDFTIRTYDLYTYVNYGYKEYPYVSMIGVIPLYRNKNPVSTETTIYRSSIPTKMYTTILNRYNHTTENYGEQTQDLDILTTVSEGIQSGQDSSLRVYDFYSKIRNYEYNYVFNYWPVKILGSRIIRRIGASTNYIYLVNKNMQFKITRRNDSATNWIMWYDYINDANIENFRQLCLTQAAYFGTLFTDSYDIAVHCPEWSIEHTYIGTIDSNGITHGEYTEGEDNKKQPQFNWEDLINDSPYNPNVKPDPGIYDEETKIVGNTKAGTAFLHVYECDYETINNLKKYLYQIVAPEATDESLTKSFLTVNPIDCITGCYEYPFTVWDRTSSPSNIILGNTTARGGDENPIVGYSVINTLRVLDFGSIYYYPFYDDFRDYEPYSEALLYIPYVGYIPISPSEFMGHNIGLKIICDLLTGSCQALVYKDGLVIESSSGNIGTQVPITGIQQADYSNSIHGASTRLLSSQVSSVASFGNAISSLITGNVGGLVNTVANVAQAGINASNAKYELEHTKVPFKQSGIASPNINFSNEQQARLILKRPQMLDSYNPSQYGHTVGFACLITAPLSNFTGFTQATNVDLSGVTATVTEKQMIQQQLQSGVYL